MPILWWPQSCYIEGYNVWRLICFKESWNFQFMLQVWSELKELVLNAYFTVIYWTVCHYAISYIWIRQQRAHWLIGALWRLWFCDSDVISSHGTQSSGLQDFVLVLRNYVGFTWVVTICQFATYMVFNVSVEGEFNPKFAPNVICYWLSMKGNA